MFVNLWPSLMHTVQQKVAEAYAEQKVQHGAAKVSMLHPFSSFHKIQVDPSLISLLQANYSTWVQAVRLAEL